MKIKYYIIGIAILVLDQVSKFLMINNNITIIQNILEFNYTKNTGGAFGIGRINLILILSIIIIVGLIIFIIKEHKKIKNYTYELSCSFFYEKKLENTIVYLHIGA